MRGTAIPRLSVFVDRGCMTVNRVVPGKKLPSREKQRRVFAGTHGQDAADCCRSCQTRTTEHREHLGRLETASETEANNFEIDVVVVRMKIFCLLPAAGDG